VRQSDGSTLTIRRAGDEYHNMAYSTDGYALLYNRATRNYEYARLDGSDIVTSGIVAADESMRDADARHFLSGIDREAIDRQFGKDWGVARAKASDRDSEGCRPGQDRVVRINYNVPTTGDRDVLVILVEFADKKFDECAGMGDPREYYDRFFHEEGFSDNGCHGSAYDYYYKGSLGKYRPDFHVLGPIQVSGGYADYAGDGGSAATYRMIQEVVPLADSMYDIDFRQFDTDGDGLIDNVYCLYAGYGQADSPVSDSIWPHSFKLSAIHAEFEVDGVTVDRYTVSQQVNGVSNLPVGIGTFVHEFGHVLGLADHYNNSSPIGNPPNNTTTTRTVRLPFRPSSVILSDGVSRLILIRAKPVRSVSLLIWIPANASASTSGPTTESIFLSRTASRQTGTAIFPGTAFLYGISRKTSTNGMSTNPIMTRTTSASISWRPGSC